MAALPSSQDRRPAAARATTSLLVKQRGSAVADGLERSLRALGVPVTLVATAYDAVTEAAGRAEPVERLIVGVDFLGPDEFRILPLFRREWPDTYIVAYHSPGFEHKGRIAELVGADLVIAGPADLSRFLRMVVSSRTPARAAAAPPRPSPAAPSAGPAGPTPARPQHVEAEAALARPAERSAASRRPSLSPAAPSTASAEPGARADVHPAFAEVLRQGPVPSEAPASVAPGGVAGARTAPAPRTPAPVPPPLEQATRQAPAPAAAPPAPERTATERAAATAPPPQPPRDAIENLDADEDLARGQVLGTVELTEEELRLLLGEDDDQ